jgi:hypothetical protein
MIGVLMGLNAIGVFGFLTRAHLDHMASVDLVLADRTAASRLALGSRAEQSPTWIGASPRSIWPSMKQRG